MKKLFAGSIVLCTLLCCIGCSTDNTRDTTGQINDSIRTTVDSGNEISGVPFILTFDSFGQIAELKNMLEEDENTVADYLESKDRSCYYSMNGILSKHDIVELFNDIGDLSMLHLDPASGYDLVNITYYLDYNYVMSTYEKGSEIVRFTCYISNSDETTTSNSGSIFKTDIVGNFSIGNKEIDLHKVEDVNSRFALASSIETTNSLITILFSDDNEETIRNIIGENMVSSTLLDLIGK